jgi:hypothetical protein
MIYARQPFLTALLRVFSNCGSPVINGTHKTWQLQGIMSKMYATTVKNITHA